MTGTLTPLSPATVATGNNPTGITVSPDGLHAYVTNFTDNTVSVYSIVSGVLVPLGSPVSLAFGANGPYDIKITPDGLHAYVSAQGVGSSIVSQYSISSGALTPLSPAGVNSGLNTFGYSAPFIGAVSSDGAHFLMTNANEGTVSQYSIGGGGLLSDLTPFTASAGVVPLGITILPGDAHVIVTDNSSQHVFQYTYSSGLLTLASSFSTTYRPFSITVDPTGSYAYICGVAPDAIYQFSISGGLLTPLSPPSAASGVTPSRSVVAPDGSHLYSTNSTSNSISQFSVSAGLLTPLSPATVSAGSGVFGIAITPNGLYVYVTNYHDNTVGMYATQAIFTVPDILGLTQSAAEAAILAAFLTVGSVTFANSVTVPAGLVMSQSPTGGTNVGVDSPVDFVVSLGPILVPNVVNSPLSLASAAITGVGLVVGTIAQVYNLTVPAGSVISQNPIGGTAALPGDAVDLVVSLGGVITPDIIGDLSSVANSAILGANLVVGPASYVLSSTISYNRVVTQDPPAGTPLLPGSTVSYAISAPGAGFNVDATVISQYSSSPTILQLVENIASDLSQSANLASFYTYVWNVDTAVGFGLDIWGKIVGASRLLKIPSNLKTFGYKNDSVPPDWQPFNQGTFFTGRNATQSYILSDSSYRTLILTKALANIVATTSQSINALLRNLFPGRGRCYVVDSGGMTMRFVFEFQLTLVEYAILTQSGVLPHPAGVQTSVVVVPPGTYFGFEEQAPVSQPFNVGIFYLPPTS